MGSRWWVILFLCGVAAVAVADTLGGGAITFPAVLSSAMCSSDQILKKSGGGGTYWICAADDGGGGGVSDGDKGDITVSGSGATWNIDASTIGSTEAAALDTADVTTGTWADARVDGSLEADEVNPTLGTQTAGNYVDNVTGDLEIVVTHTPGEGSEPALAIASTITRDTELSAYQPVDSDLTSIAALTTTAHGRGLLDDADAAASRTSIDAQQLDSDLTSVAALTTTTGGRSILASTPADDQVYVGDSASAGTWRSIPDCGESGTLNYTAATNSFSCLTDSGGGGSGITYADASAAYLAGF